MGLVVGTIACVVVGSVLGFAGYRLLIKVLYSEGSKR